MVNSDRDLNELREQYAHWATEDLLRVIHSPRDYRPQAVQAAQEILAQREPSDLTALTTAVVEELDQERQIKDKLSEEPLSTFGRVLCFVFCGIPGIVFAAYQEAKGRSRRAGEAWKWVGYGWLARVGLVIIGLLLSIL